METPAAETTQGLKWWFWIFFFGTITYMIWMRQVLLPLEPGEIILFEMAKTSEKATEMIRQWKSAGKFDLVVRSVNLDYFFIILYTGAIAIACRYLSGLTHNSILGKAGIFFSFFIIVAGLFDLAENMAMMKSLGRSVTDKNVGLAYKMAISKFSIVLMSLFFVVICFFSWIANRFDRKEMFWKPGE